MVLKYGPTSPDPEEGLVSADFDLASGSPTAHNTHNLELPDKQDDPPESFFRSKLQYPNDLFIP